MKKIISLIMSIIICTVLYSQSPQLYIGISGGLGDMLVHDKLLNIQTSQGAMNLTKNNNGLSYDVKAEALLGFGRLRFGYQFMYDFASPSIRRYSFAPEVNSNQYTIYFNGTKNHFFGQYFLLELVAINKKHFSLVPGFAIGPYTGYKKDNTTGDEVRFSVTTYHRLSIGAELNAEIKFAKRCTILVGPNYYLFKLQDRIYSGWHEFSNFIGADLGFRINLLKLQK